MGIAKYNSNRHRYYTANIDINIAHSPSECDAEWARLGLVWVSSLAGNWLLKLPALSSWVTTNNIIRLSQ